MLLIGKSKFRDTHRSVSKQVLCMTRSSADSHLASGLVCLSSCGIAELSRVVRLCGDSRASANRGAGRSLRCCHGLRQEFHIESGNNPDYRGCSRQQRSHGERLPSELRAYGVGRRLGVARSKGSPDRRPRARRRACSSTFENPRHRREPSASVAAIAIFTLASRHDCKKADLTRNELFYTLIH